MNDVSIEEVDEAYDRWQRAFGMNTDQAFWKFLETDFHYAWAGSPLAYHYRLNETGHRKLGLLLGPHHHAIIRAYKIQHQKPKK